MGSPDPRLADGWDSIPDPAAAPVAPPPPAPVLPAEPSLTRPERHRRALLCAALSLAWIGAILAWRGPRPDLATPAVIAPAALWTLTAALALALALRQRRRGLPPGIRAIELVIAGVPLAYGLAALAASAGVAEVPLHFDAWRGGGGCATMAGLIGAGPLVLAAIALRRSFPSAPALRGAAVGAVAGLSGAVGVYLLCPLQARSHLLLAHGLPLLLLALAGAALGALGGRP